LRKYAFEGYQAKEVSRVLHSIPNKLATAQEEKPSKVWAPGPAAAGLRERKEARVWFGPSRPPYNRIEKRLIQQRLVGRGEGNVKSA